MSDFTRFAIYYVPPSGPLEQFGAQWLGWDIATGSPAQHPHVDGLDIGAVTETPRKYGFHATLKPPFRLAGSHGEVELQSAVADLADILRPVKLDGLKMNQIGSFLAFTVEGSQSGLNALAAACVRELDHFRAPASASETERRKSAGLTDRQTELLMQWGYPYVMEEFKFHMTLTGKLDPDTTTRSKAAIEALSLGALPRPFVVDAIALVGERPDGRFETIRRYSLNG
jgi:putative phosphonate metabolism protein